MAMDASLEIAALEAASLINAVHDDLCELVIDAVSDGASVGWVSVPTLSDASLYWQLVASQVDAGTIVLLVAQIVRRCDWNRATPSLRASEWRASWQGGTASRAHQGTPSGHWCKAHVSC